MSSITFSANVNSTVGVAPNDIYLDKNGNLSLSYDLDSIIQQCSQAAKTQLGEMVLNINQGIPYFDQIWVGVVNVEPFASALRAAFLAIPDVVEVVSLITEQISNTLNYSAIIRTTFGTGAVNGAI
jgi:hypothetical protein